METNRTETLMKKCQAAEKFREELKKKVQIDLVIKRHHGC